MLKSRVSFKRSDTVMHGFCGVSPKSPLRLIHYSSFFCGIGIEQIHESIGIEKNAHHFRS
jgi:hypothetical protein